jgi:hypothetical protein
LVLCISRSPSGRWTLHSPDFCAYDIETFHSFFA